MKFLNRTAFLVGFLIAGWVANAHSQASVSGRVVDQQSRQALPYATVVFQRPVTQDMVTGGITDEEGRFSVTGLEKGTYRILCSFVGYRPDSLTVLLGEKNDIYDIGDVALAATSVQLDDVVVEARRAVVAAGLDKKSFSMADQTAQAGGSVLDAMRGLPGITVDQEGKVLLRGSDRVAVLIDGKQSSLTGFGNQQGLDHIPATQIDRIEIINNPSARYDASGMAGIINIIYKQEEDFGLQTQLGLAVGSGALTSRRHDLPTELGSFTTNHKYIPSLNLNFRNTDLHTFFQAEILDQRRLPNNEFTSRTYGDGRRTVSQVPENRTQTQYILQGGTDWFIDENNTLTLSALWDYESHIDTAQVPYIDQVNQQRFRLWHWSEDEVTGFFNVRLDYERALKQIGHTLKASVQYTRGWEDEQYFLNDSSAVRQSVDTTHIDATENTTTFLLDYVKPLRYGRMEAGSKVQIRTIPVTYIIGPGPQSIIYPGLGDWSDWGENVYAGYANFVYERPRFDVEAGLRTEYASVSYDIAPENIYYAQNDAYDYFEFYPNVRLTYKINEHNSLSVFYNRRIDRPGEPELRIFPKYDDPELLKVGNPYLRPQFTQTAELAYKRDWQGGSFFVSGYYRHIQDPFLRIYNIDSTSVGQAIVNKIYQNVGAGSQVGTEILITQKIGSHWDLSGSVNGYNNRIDAYTGQLLFPYQRPFTILETEDVTWEVKLHNRIALPGQVQIQVTGIYMAPKNIPQGRQRARSSIDLGLKKGVFQGRGEISVSVTDLFNNYGIKQEVNETGFNVLYENYYETQTVRVGFTYKF